VHKEIVIATLQTSNNGKVGTKNKGPNVKGREMENDKNTSKIIHMKKSTSFIGNW
jgi:hypothetical protein